MDYYDIEWFALETNRDHSVIFESSPKYCILYCFVDYEGYSISFKGFLPTVEDIMVILIKFAHSSPFYFTNSLNVNVHSCHFLFDHFRFTFIHGPNIPGSYAILFFIALDFLPSSVTSTPGHCFCFGSISSFFLELFLHSSPVALATIIQM